MKKYLSIIGIVAALSPSLAFAFNLEEYEASTQTAANYVSGKLDARLIELGSNKETKEFMPIWGRTQKDGVTRYCSFYMKSMTGDGSKCSRTINVKASNGIFNF